MLGRRARWRNRGPSGGWARTHWRPRRSTTARRSNGAGDLPYLLKLMAAAEPLSLQTHPDRSVPRPGSSAKSSWALPATRPSASTATRSPSRRCCAPLTASTRCAAFVRSTTRSRCCTRSTRTTWPTSCSTRSWRPTVAALYRGEFDIASTITACRQHDRRRGRLVTELAAKYPGDPSVVVTLLLNRVMLGPGEAVFLGPGNLHAYLRGFGVEVMANSDNVVRGGMTVKHVDVEELLDVLDFEPLRATRRQAGRGRPGSVAVRHADDAVRVVALRARRRRDVAAHQATGRELLLWVSGAATAASASSWTEGETVELRGPARCSSSKRPSTGRRSA